MSKKSVSKVPRFYGFRIFAFSILLYYLLILPFLLILTIKYAPKFRQFGQLHESIINDTVLRLQPGVTAAPDTITMDTAASVRNENQAGTAIKINGEGAQLSLPGDRSRIGGAISLTFNVLIISLVLGFLFNLPFNRYFTKKRKNRPISQKLYNHCKKYLLKIPLYNTAIMAAAFLAGHVYMAYIIVSGVKFDLAIEKELFIEFFFISLTSSVLSLMFVYFWEKHRVHIRYIEHIFNPTELQRRIFRKFSGKIRNRLVISSIMTTLLPLTIVILYLFLSLTRVKDFGTHTFTGEEKAILFGDYMSISNFAKADATIPGWLFYVNVVNSFFMFIGIYSGIFTSFIYIFFFVKWTTQDIVNPIMELLNNMRLTGQGELNHFSIVRTNDEIGELTEGYNEMSQRLKDYIYNISLMNEAYLRFVPKQFLDFLGKKSFINIKLGDQVQKEMTVLFSDIRSFTELSELMSPKENFDFINEYLGCMEPVISRNNGFIDKYMGDAIMALFPEKPDDAVNAAIEMMRKLEEFNEKRKKQNKIPIRIGIGLHTGILMLGVIGGEGRFDGTVISDAVNLSSRLEGLTKIYGCSAILSFDTIRKMQYPGQFRHRFLDVAKVKGKKQEVHIYEILDCEEKEVRDGKVSSKEKFEEGVKVFLNKNYEEALKYFIEIRRINAADMASQLYIERCMEFIRNE